MDDAGFGHIRSKGDRALFGGYTTQEMKERLGVKDNRQLADFLPTLSIAAKNLAAEMTNYNVEEKDLQGESAITGEHVQNNRSVRDMLGQRGIQPENQHDRAAADGDLEQVRAEPRGRDAQHQRGKARDGGARGVEDGREGHHGQRHVGDIEQK